MLKKTATTSPELTAFVEKRQLPLSEAQHRHVIAERSPHNIMSRQPDVVIEAILWVL